QFFGGNSLAYRHQGDLTPASIGFNPFLNRYTVNGPFDTPEVNRMTVVNDMQANRRFATAGQVLVGFANSFAFEFTGEDVSLASSLANFSFIQPLLRGAGRDIALEQLTLSERRLLANLRAYSQFRQGFFTQIVIGELGVSGPQRFGTGTNLQSFSGFGGVNGYLGLLQQAQQIRNTEGNLRLQLRTLERLEALYENELIDIVQVDQFRQNIENTRASLLDQTNGLELAIDIYTTQILGLPSDLPIDLDEQLVEQFQLVPVETASLAEELIELQQRIGEIGELSDLVARGEILGLELPGLVEQDFTDAESTLRRLKGFVDAAGRQVKNLPSDIEPLEEVGDGELSTQFADASLRIESVLDNLTEDNFADQIKNDAGWYSEIFELSQEIVSIRTTGSDLASEPERVIGEIEQFIDPVRELFAGARGDLERMEEVAAERERSMNDEQIVRFRSDRLKLNERLEDLALGDSGLEVAVRELEQLRDGLTTANRAQTIRSLTAWIQSYLQLVERLALVPAQARLEIVSVEAVELEPEAAGQIALENRLDFMNGRAALVDRWRAIQVAADALQSDLTITGEGDIRTAKNNPVDFKSSTGRLRLGIEFDAPLARLLERNGYREALIDYQRNRRNLIQSQDALQLGLRALLRTLEQRRLQLEIQRRAVTIALRRVDQTELSLLTPPPQGQPGVRPQINPTTAINLLASQSSLQSSQNSFLAAWLSYYAARLRLYRELGVMQLDADGKWIENSFDFSGDSQPEASAEEFESLPPPMPFEVMEVDYDSADASADRTAEPAGYPPVNVARQDRSDVPATHESSNPLVRMVRQTTDFVRNR
ncbi:MAG: TolC family protein, partial [Rubripirellula sp.]